MKTINLAKILSEHGCPDEPFDGNVTVFYPALIEAMREACNQTTELTVENANEYLESIGSTDTVSGWVIIDTKKQVLRETDVIGLFPLSEWLQTTKEGRHLMMQITFPIADQFNTSPEKVPIDLVVQIVEAVRGNDC